MGNFLVRRKSASEPRSLQIPFAAPEGLAVSIDPTNITKAVKADSYGFYGFVTQAVTATGNADQLKLDAWLPGTVLKYDGKINDTITIVDALEVEAEGSTLVLNSGTAAITAATPPDTNLSFIDGKFCVAQTGQQPTFNLVTAGVTPETEGNVRILAVRI